MITETQVSLTVEFTMSNPTDYLAMIDATCYLLGAARRYDIDVDRCSFATSAFSGRCSVTMYCDQSFDSPAASATAEDAD